MIERLKKGVDEMKKILMVTVALVVSLSAVEVGKVPSTVVLNGKNGGTVEGKPWSSQSLHGKVHILLYVDPDERKKNDPLTKALKAQQFDQSKFASVAVINLAATWLPNVVLESLLKKKQKEFPRTVYVKDKKKVLVKRWALADDESDVLLFDRDGKLLYKKYGRLSDAEIAALIALIKQTL